MESIKNFDALLKHLQSGGARKRVAVVWPGDEKTPLAVAHALEAGIIDAIMVGCREQIEKNDALRPYSDHITIVDAADNGEAATRAVAMIREGEADVLMKGLINTDDLLRAVLNKETGILPKGNVLTHATIAQIPNYNKLLFFSDAAVIPYPTNEQRTEIVRYIAKLGHSFGIEEPRIALIHCTEKINGKHFAFTEGYPAIIEKAQAGEFGKCIVDGPMDAKCACSLHALQAKGLHSPINGEADALIMPDIEAGNIFYKAITLFAGADTAGLLMGAKCPVVVPSRADSSRSKFYSLAAASILSNAI